MRRMAQDAYTDTGQARPVAEKGTEADESRNRMAAALGNTGGNFSHLRRDGRMPGADGGSAEQYRQYSVLRPAFLKSGNRKTIRSSTGNGAAPFAAAV